MKVAVIGAGPSGISTVRHLADKPEVSHVTAYDTETEIGGLWLYTDLVGQDERGRPIPSSAYRDLCTNDTVELIQFPDLDYKDPLPPGSFVPRQKVLEYLNDYVDHFNLRQHFQLNTEVVRVDPSTDEAGRVQWHVDVRRLDDPQRPLVKEIYDAVFVCNGQFTVPCIPDIPGLDTFKGTIMNSHDFRKQEVFEGQTVICAGAGPSGLDISVLIAKHAKQVYLSHSSLLVSSSCVFPDNERPVPYISQVRERSVVLEDGEELEVDAIVLCTGYRYHFPFLSDRCRPKIEDERLTPLYKHTIHVEFPSLFFIGMMKFVFFFRVTPFQAQFAVASLLGRFQLPSKDEMLKDIDDDFKAKLALNFPPRYAHHMFPPLQLFKPYHDGIVEMANHGGQTCVDPIPEKYMRHMEHTVLCMTAAPGLLRTRRYTLDTDWTGLPGQHRFPLHL